MWQRIELFPRKDVDLIRELVRIEDGEPFWCMYRNTARFERLMYCW